MSDSVQFCRDCAHCDKTNDLWVCIVDPKPEADYVTGEKQRTFFSCSSARITLANGPKCTKFKRAEEKP